MPGREFIVLYTSQKIQKAKKWHDGVLKTSFSGNKATLYDDKGLCLDHIYVRFGEVKSGKEFESDRYLITVEEEKTFQEKATNSISEEAATKPVTTNVNLSNPARRYLPVGLKRKYTGFQGPREMSKKLTTEQNDASFTMAKSQNPSSSFPQLNATSLLFSTLCAKKASSCSAFPQEESSETTNRDSTSSQLPSTVSLSQYCALRDSDEMNMVYSVDGFAAMASNPEGCSHSNRVHENKRSKDQILALLDRKTESRCNMSENHPQEPSVGSDIACATDIPSHHAGYFPGKMSDPRLALHCDMELPANCDVSGNLSEGLGIGSSLNIQEIQQKCEKKEEPISPNTKEQTEENYTNTGETLDNNVCQAKECYIKLDNPSELLSATHSDHSEKPIAQVELSTLSTNNFDDINFDLLGEFISEENGANLYENEMLPQRSLNTCSAPAKPIPAFPMPKYMEVHQTDHVELKAWLPVAEEEDLDPILQGNNQTEIISRNHPNTASLSEKHSPGPRKYPIHEPKELRFKADDYSLIHAPKDTISLLKSLSEHSNAIESLEKLNVQKPFEDCAMNGGLEQAFNRSEEITGVSTERSLYSPRNSSTEFSCLAEDAKYAGVFEEHVNNNRVERITISDVPLRTLQITDLPFDAPSLHDESNFNVAREGIRTWYENDQVPVEPLSSDIPDQFISSGSYSDFELTPWNMHKVISPMQQVPSVDAFLSSMLRHSRDSNVGELDYSVPNHQLSTSAYPFDNERTDSFVKDGESKIQSTLRLRSPVVTLPDKCINQTLPSNFPADLSSIIEPRAQCSTIYSVNSQQGNLCDSSEKKLWSKHMNNSYNMSENTDTCITEYPKPMNHHSTLQNRSSKWMKYQISSNVNHDDHSEENHMFEKGSDEVLVMHESVKDPLSVQLIKAKLVKHHENILPINEIHSAPNISSMLNGYSVPSKTNHVLSWKNSNNTSLSELCFPKADAAQGAKSLKRQVTIPTTFSSTAHYKEAFTAAITEYLNVLLNELSQKLHKTLSKVDMTRYSSEKVNNTKNDQHFLPLCQHQQPAKLIMVKKEGPNKGRLFYTCDASKKDQCKFFKWLDHLQPIELNQKMEHQAKLQLADAKSLSAFFRSQHVPLYCECQLHIRKTSGYQRKRFYRGKWKEMINDASLENCCKTKLYLRLSWKDHSSAYNKDDLWVISKTLKFDPIDTFIACSAFYGPSSNGEIELLPVKGYSPSNWPSDMIVHALFIGNVTTELTCLRNLQEHVNSASLPLMPYLLKMPEDEEELIIRSARQQFISPAVTKPAWMTGLLCKERTMQLTMEMIQAFHLNTDQGAAFKQVATMIAKGENSQDLILPVTVIHGVYGAGKSYLLAVMILFLVQLFEESEASEGPRQVRWKLLVSASTNVAVDRVLLGLLELGFDKFIRVGSIRKIAKPILPYSLHAGSDSEELRELQALLKDDLTPVEKVHVRRCIEQHKLGRNRALLKEIKVVGVTCAACPFHCMNNLSFPLVLLDECSQITEPTSLLPIARFACEKLILVGDPKQLPPTIQGSESAHDAGLEQTLFDRMCLMGHKPVMLRTQYRCHPAISAITNELFYDGNLIDGLSTLNQNPLLDWLPTLCFYNVKGQEQMEMLGSYHNLEEATFTTKLIQSLVASGIMGSMIGVITLYKSQMYKLCGLLNYMAQCELAQIKAVQVSTVDAFQGAEKEIIVLSCVRTQQVGFIDSEKRMNVALTRGKKHLLIVGNLTCLRNNRQWGKVIHHCEGRKNGLQHARQCEPELEKILKCYNEQKLIEKNQKGKRKLTSRNESVLSDENNKTINTTEGIEGNETFEV
ncbi:5'-3' DNA helicase ZGRF1-like isoform X2 [Rhinoraja longicauda]